MKKILFGIRPSIFISVGMAAAIGIWLWSGQWSNANEAQPSDKTAELAAVDAKADEAQGGTGSEPMAKAETVVETVLSRAQMHQASLTINGQTDFDRMVVIRSETTGRITAVDMEESHPVQEGKVIARIAIDDRQASLDEAKALLSQREIEFSAAKKLAKRGFQSEIKKAEAEANLSAAKAALRRAQIDLNNTVIHAPFDGYVRVQSVEIGDYVEANSEIATIIDLDPIYVKGQVSEREIGAVELGALSAVTMINGQSVQGIVSRIAPAANNETRTFEVAVEVSNPEGRIPAGITASLRLPSKQILAHLLSPALLTLNDDGEVGIKIVDPSGIVQFLPVTIIEDTKQGMWVAGLPQEANIISVGQEYVVSGQHVSAAPATEIN